MNKNECFILEILVLDKDDNVLSKMWAYSNFMSATGLITKSGEMCNLKYTVIKPEGIFDNSYIQKVNKSKIYEGEYITIEPSAGRYIGAVLGGGV